MSKHVLKEQLARYLSFHQQDQHNIAILLDISLLYADLNDLEAAQEYLNKANALDRIACLAHQGNLYLQRGLLTEAKNSFLEALTYQDTPALRYHLTYTCFLLRHLEEAEQTIAPLLHQNDPMAKFLYARILHQKQQIMPALKLVQEVLELNPHDADALGLMAIFYLDLGKEELAKKFCHKALSLNPDNYEAKLVNLLLRLVTHETTINEINALIQTNPHDSRLWFALGNSYMVEGDFLSAEDALQKAIDNTPQFYDCYIALAWCQLTRDKLSAAQATYQQALAINSNLADAWED